MILLLAASALGFAPVEPHHPPPVFERPRTAQGQVRLADDPVLAELSARWGGGWVPRYDEGTGLLAGVWLPGIPIQRAELLAHSLAPHAQLELVNDHQRGERRILSWRQLHQGVPVWGSEVALFSHSGRIGAARLHLHAPPSGVDATEADWWFPVGKQLVPVVQEVRGDEVLLWSLGGQLVRSWSTRSYATATHSYEERSPYTGTAWRGIPFVTVSDATTTTTTDASGVHGLGSPWSMELSGPWLHLHDWSSGVPSFSGLDGDVLLEGGGDLSWAEADALAHYWIVRDWLESVDPDHGLLDIQMDVTVGRSDSHCNAWYSGGSMTFLSEGWGCQDLARVADVMYHEYGHGVHHYAIATGTFAGDISEGAADYVSATLTGDPQVGLGWAGSTSYIRELSSDHVYPDDMVGEVHYDGLIFGSMMWNLRQQAIDDLGEEAGVAWVDGLLVGILEQGPVYTSVGDALIVADDDDGDLTNGTPHGCELLSLLDQHGLGPGPIGVVLFEHEPLEHASSWDESYPLDFLVVDALPDCSGLDRDSVRLWWTTDDPGQDDLDDAFEAEGSPASGSYTSAGGAQWQELSLSEADSLWSGDLPRQLAGTKISYFLEARATDDAERITSHGSDLAQVDTLWVGDRAPLWCEGFEGEVQGWTHGTGTPWQSGDGDDVDQWAFGELQGAWWDPSEAWSEHAVAGTTLDGDGQYRNNNAQYLLSPEVPVEGEGRMRMITMRRWLTVEDALYDQARLYLNGELIWENEATPEGSTHHLDRRWTEVAIPLQDQTSVQLAFTLRSDQGLEYGGWTLDNVCVMELADVPGHYRVRDLVATDELEERVELSWTNPWIAPLDTVVVVRKRDAWPADRADGVVVYLDESPEPGARVEAQDTEVLEGETFYYAVFASVSEGEWHDLTVVDGDNGDLGGVPATPPIDTGDTDPRVDTGDPPDDTETPADTGEPDEPEGCGCATGGVGGLGLVLPLIIVGLRRRR